MNRTAQLLELEAQARERLAYWQKVADEADACGREELRRLARRHVRDYRQLLESLDRAAEAREANQGGCDAA